MVLFLGLGLGFFAYAKILGEPLDFLKAWIYNKWDKIKGVYKCRKKKHEKIQLVTVIAVVVLFILILVLVTLVSQKVQMNAKKKRLVEQQDALQQMIENGLEDYEYRQSLEYIEKYAREELGMIDAGDTIWKQAD